MAIKTRFFYLIVVAHLISCKNAIRGTNSLTNDKNNIGGGLLPNNEVSSHPLDTSAKTKLIMDICHELKLHISKKHEQHKIDCGTLSYFFSTDKDTSHVSIITFSGFQGDFSYDEEYYYQNDNCIYLHQTVRSGSTKNKEDTTLNDFFFEKGKLLFSKKNGIINPECDTSAIVIANDYLQLYTTRNFDSYSCY